MSKHKTRLWWYRFRRYIMRCRLTRRKVTILGLVLLLLVGLYSLLLKHKFMCTNMEVRQHLKKLCDDHDGGRVYGDACAALCGGGGDGGDGRDGGDGGGTVVIPDSCQARHSGKEVVFGARWNGREVFVKAAAAAVDSPVYHKAFKVNGTTGERVYPDLNDFEFMVEQYLRDNLGIELQGSIFQRFWGVEFNREDDRKLLARAMDSAWALAQSNEFVLSTLYQQFDVFPEVYGSCGGFYVVEKVDPLNIPQVLERQTFKNWALRVRTALKLLDLLEELDSIFDEGPLLLCDVKPEHFGVSEHGRIKIVDSDNSGFKSVVDKIVGSGQNCSSHAECDYFDCRGTCDLVEGICFGEVVNNNLQAVCEKVFLSRHENLFFEFLGLLSSRHMGKGLRAALKRCANPTNSKENIRLGADDATRKEISRGLREILDVDRKLAQEDDDGDGGDDRS